MATLIDYQKPSNDIKRFCSMPYGRIYDFGDIEEHVPAWMRNDQTWLWEFRDPIAFQTPIPCKGNLRLWSPDKSYHAEIERQMQCK